MEDKMNKKILGMFVILLVTLAVVPMAFAGRGIVKTVKATKVDIVADEIMEEPVTDSFEKLLINSIGNGDNFVMCNGDIPNGDITYCAIGEAYFGYLGINMFKTSAVYKKENGNVVNTGISFQGAFSTKYQKWIGTYNGHLTGGDYGAGTWEGYNLFDVEGSSEQTSGEFIILPH